MATYNKFQPFVEKLAEKAHNLGSDTLTLALTTNANAPVATNGVLADLTQIAYTNLSSRVLTISSSSQTSGTYKLVIAPLTLTASGGSVATFRHVVMYNDTAASKELIGYWDDGADVTLADTETYTFDADAGAGVLTLA